MIKVTNLTRNYGSLKAVDSISFEIPKGQIIGLLGHNGAGKTTTLRMITGYLESSQGDILVDNLNMEDNRIEIQKKIGYLSEQSPLYPDMSIWQYLDYVAQLRGIPENDRAQAVKDAILSTDLAQKAGDSIDTLSKGYRQRVGVAQAIIHKPEILILDEPTNGLDPTQINAMRDLIKNLAKKSTVIISTHIMQEVEAICDRVLIILNGKLAVDSDLKELQKANNITLAVKQPLEEVKSLLEKIDSVEGVEKIKEQDSLMHYRILTTKESDATTADVARSVFEKGWDLYHIHREHRNLETVFRDVNRNHGGSHV